ncbi:hypothetical protein [Rhodococcus sp. NPDC006774]|uniref:hypothetical protein n=1 Tax=Rhodococcus sp. NPDC006774 TaxID=3157186 RepID=UPI0033ED998B
MRMSRLVAVTVTLTFMASGCSSSDPDADRLEAVTTPVRVATFNASLNRPVAGQLVAELQGEDAQARAAADVIAANSPDVLLVNEFDYSGQDAVTLFNDRYLDGQYPHSFTAPVNTGVDSGLDLDRDGTLGGPGDAWGVRPVPGPVRDGRVLEVSDRHRFGTYVPELPVEGHAGFPAAA